MKLLKGGRYILKRLSILDTKVNIETLSTATFFLYVFMFNTANHTPLLQIAILLMIGSSSLLMICKKKVNLSMYFFIYIFFIIYNVYLIKRGIAQYSNNSIAMTKTLVINVIINFYLFNLCMLKQNKYNLIKVYVYACLAGTISLFIFGWQTILAGRFLFSGTINFLGVPVVVQANYTGFIAAIASLLTTFLWAKEDKSKCIKINLVFIICILLTGSRKSLGVVIGGTFIILNILFPKSRYKNIFVFIIISSGLYFGLMNIPIFYNKIGYRLEETINYLFTGYTAEASMTSRNNMIKIGMDYYRLKPITGYGLDAYRDLPKTYGVYSHNNFVEILVSGGVIGFIIYYSTMVFVIIRLIFIKVSDKMKQGKYLFISIIIIMIIMDYWSVSYFERSNSTILILALAIISKSKIKRAQTINREYI